MHVIDIVYIHCVLQAACGYASEVISLVPDSDLALRSTAKTQPPQINKSGN